VPVFDASGEKGEITVVEIIKICDKLWCFGPGFGLERQFACQRMGSVKIKKIESFASKSWATEVGQSWSSTLVWLGSNLIRLC
jgi:hypothetical protein